MALFHQILESKDIKLIEQFMETIIIDISDSGLVSNYIKGLIILDKKKEIINFIQDKKLKKRDLLALCLYLNDINYFVLAKDSLIDQDIDYLIQNNMINCLELLDGYFLKRTLDWPYNTDNLKLKLKLYYLRDQDISHAMIYLKNKIKHHFDYFNKIVKKPYNLIIDGSNVLHSRNGLPNYDDLHNIISLVKQKGFEPLLIIHKRHLRKEHFNCYYFGSPYNLDDDLFLLLAFTLNQGRVHILSNDQYRDHPFTNYYKMILHQQTLNYDNDKYIEPIKLYSECIQVIGDNIFIPKKEIS